VPPSQLTANPDSYAAGQGKALTVSATKGVLVNDRDPQGKPLIAILDSNPAHGSLTFRPDGSFIYTNDGTGASQDSFTYQVSNGTALSNITSVTITLGAPDAITAAPDFYSLPHGGSITVGAPGVLANDLDPIGLTLTAATLAPPLHGSLTLSPNGGFTYAHDGTNSTSDTFAYRATDGTLTSSSTNAFLTIGPDSPPTVGSQSYATMQNTPLTVAAPGVLTGATDPDSPTITAVLQNTAAHGSVTLNPNGSFSYTPATGFSGADSFTFRGSDGIVSSVNPGTASIAVAAIPRPSAVDDRFVATTSALTINAPGILGNDTMNGGTVISFGRNGNDQTGIGHPAVTSNNGQITLNADGSFTYNAPSPTFAGDDTFRYIVGNSSGTSTATVIVTVAPLNTNCPGMTIGPAALPSGSAGVAYPAVSFSQTGGAAPIAWATGTLPSGMTFSNAGVLSGTPAAIGSFNITVSATDANACVVIKTLTLDVGCPLISIGATNLVAGTVGVAYPATTLSAAGGMAPLTWSVTSGVLPAGMSLSGSGVLSGAPSQIGLFSFTVKATDANSCLGVQNLSLTVNPRCPAITIGPTTLPGAAAGVVYPAVSFSQIGGALPVTWSSGALPPGMSFSSAGVLSGTPTSIGVFNVMVTATDANSCSATLSLPLGVNITCPTIAISATNLPAATTGAAYPALTLAETGGIGPFTWSLAAGTLPAGMTLSSAGVLSGTPTQTASFFFTVKATDANGCFGTQTLSLTVNAKCPAITITPTTLTSGKPGVVYPAVSFSQSGGAAPVTWSAISLPQGLTLSTGGVLSGTPAIAGVFNLTITAADANSCTATVVVPLAIDGSCPAITIAAPFLATPVVGTAYPSVTLQANGGVAPIVWSIALGTLPPGLTLSPAGVLSGAPTQTGTFTATVKATDANGCSGTTSIILTVSAQCAGITISGTPPNGKAGVVYPAFSFSQSGGALPVTWSSGALPAGMTFSSAGVLSGTPIVRGNFTLALQVIDANSCAGTISIPFVIDCPTISITASSTIGPGTLPAATVATVYSPIVFSQTGGVGAIVWSLDAGTLPAGIIFSNTGTLSGTPIRAGTSTIAIKATDANGCSSTATYTLTVSCQPITVTNPLIVTGNVNVPFTATFTQSGGQGATTFSTTSALPAGLSLAAATGILSGTPSQIGSFPITVTATDSGGCTASSTGYTLVIACGTITVNNPATTSGGTGSLFSQTFTATGAVGATTFTLASGSLPNGLTLATTGVLSGTPTQIGTFPITVKATDANSCTGTSSTYNLAIACGPLAVANPATTTAAANSPFSAQFTATGANGTTTFTLLSGVLPAGLQLSSSGLLSGTPVVQGSFPITVKATDANGCQSSGSAVYPLVIACPTITVTKSAGTLSALTSNPYLSSYTATGGSAPYSFGALTTLVQGLLHPSGLAVDSSGNIYIADTNHNEIRKWTAVSNTLTTLVSGLIQPAGVAVDGSGNVYIADTGNSAIKKWSASSGSVTTLVTSVNVNHPAGLALDASGNIYIADTSNNAVRKWTASNGQVTTLASGLTLPSGVAVDGSGNVFIADSGSGAIRKWTASNGQVTLIVGSLSNPSDVTVDASGNLYIAETGSGAIRKWTASSGTLSTLVSGLSSPLGVALDNLGRVNIADTNNDVAKLLGTPPGLTLSAGGDLSGTPTLKGTFPIRIIATDANACFGSSVFNLNIQCGGISVFNPGSVSGTTGTFFSIPFASGGTNGPVVYTTTDVLPIGLTLNSNGVLSGTPLQQGGFSIQVTATDANGCSATGDLYSYALICHGISVFPNSTLISHGSTFDHFEDLTGAGLGFAQSGAVVNTTYTLSSGSLPPGISLQSNGILTGQIQFGFGFYSPTITVTDGAGCTGSTSYEFRVCIPGQCP
jgi:sugar lactone lactonase YvrE